MSEKSKEKIKCSLLKLMKENEFQEITIAEICGWCNISRGTFYNHFDTKEDVIAWKSRLIIENILEEFESVGDDWVGKLASYFFEQSRVYGDYLMLLSRQKLFYIYRDELLKAFFNHEKVVTQKEYLQLPEHSRRYTVLAFVSSGLAVYEEWAATGFELSSEEITEIYINTINNPTMTGKEMGE